MTGTSYRSQVFPFECNYWTVVAGSGRQQMESSEELH